MLLPSIFQDNFVDDFFGDMFTFSRPFNRKSTFSSPVSICTDVQEFDDSYQLDFELPGFSKEDIQAELKDGYLTIQAEHSENKDEKDKEGNYIRRERYRGQYRRSFFVGKDVTQEDIKAKFDNGILKVEIPKKEKTPEIDEKKYITIEG